MVERSEVEQFLNELHAKMKVGRVIFEQRQKNLETILRLDMAHPDAERIKIIGELSVEDYSEGPKVDDFGISPLWVFGRLYKQREIYIKIQLLSLDVYCISFHESEYPMSYPFKK